MKITYLENFISQSTLQGTLSSINFDDTINIKDEIRFSCEISQDLNRLELNWEYIIYYKSLSFFDYISNNIFQIEDLNKNIDINQIRISVILSHNNFQNTFNLRKNEFVFKNGIPNLNDNIIQSHSDSIYHALLNKL